MLCPATFCSWGGLAPCMAGGKSPGEGNVKGLTTEVPPCWQCLRLQKTMYPQVKHAELYHLCAQPEPSAAAAAAAAPQANFFLSCRSVCDQGTPTFV